MLSIVALVLPLFHIWGLLTRGVPASIRSLVPREKLVKQITVHKRQFKEGLQRCVVSSAIDSSSLVDREALIWTLTKLDEEQEVQVLISRIPRFLDSCVVPRGSRQE